MAAYSGFAEENYDSVFITLDKMDKIGVEGVASELAQDGYPQENIDKYLDLFKLLEQTRDVTEGVNILSEKLGEYLDEEVVTNMTEIATAVNATKGAKFELVFDPTLVRGMSYYTGTIFEISMPELGAACGGGGRYDKMIGKFTGNDVPACGFSIGFERIILLLSVWYRCCTANLLLIRFLSVKELNKLLVALFHKLLLLEFLVLVHAHNKHLLSVCSCVFCLVHDINKLVCRIFLLNQISHLLWTLRNLEAALHEKQDNSLKTD